MALTDVAVVRLLIGDKDEDDYALTDDEIEYILDLYGDDPRAAAPEAAGCAALAMTQKAADETTGSMSVSYSQRAALYRQTAIDLGWVGVGRAGVPQMGGLVTTPDDTEPKNADDRIFTLDLHDNKSTTGSTDGS